MSPRLTSISSARVSNIDCPSLATDSASSPSINEVTRDRRPELVLTSSSPILTSPAATWPVKPRKSCEGRHTHCTGMRNDNCGSGFSRDASDFKAEESRLKSLPPRSTVSRCSSKAGPVNHGIAVERDITLSPTRPDKGIAVTLAMPSEVASAW